MITSICLPSENNEQRVQRSVDMPKMCPNHLNLFSCSASFEDSTLGSRSLWLISPYCTSAAKGTVFINQRSSYIRHQWPFFWVTNQNRPYFCCVNSTFNRWADITLTPHVRRMQIEPSVFAETHSISDHQVEVSLFNWLTPSTSLRSFLARPEFGSELMQPCKSVSDFDATKHISNIPVLSSRSPPSAYSKSNGFLSKKIATPLFPHVDRAISIVIPIIKLQRKHEKGQPWWASFLMALSDERWP